MFQSPSLRGSGRFVEAPSAHRLAGPGFNPLHCGAVVASRIASISDFRRRVSIPFIAGQWSLQDMIILSPKGQDDVSIPFIAGQWSLRTPTRRKAGGKEVSIPFIAGQWSLRRFRRTAASTGIRVSIPFIAGQWSLRPAAAQRRRRSGRVSIPFIAGQWSLQINHDAEALLTRLFQSPSLRGSGRFRFRGPGGGGG